MRFKTDENLPAEVPSALLAAGHDSVSVRDQRLRGAADTAVASACQRERRAPITLDQDFADIRSYPPAAYAGLVVLRLRQQDKANVLDVLARLIPLFDTEPLVGRLWVVDESAVRIRPG